MEGAVVGYIYGGRFKGTSIPWVRLKEGLLSTNYMEVRGSE